MVYDVARDELVIVGSHEDGSTTTNVNNTWTWDGSNWTDVTPGTIPTFSAGKWQDLAYDKTNGNTVYFGGNASNFDSPGTYNNNTWIWDGSSWTQVFPTHKPSARSGVMMNWSEANGKVLLQGGYDATNFYTDTWTWDGTDWTQLSPANHPVGGGPFASCSFRNGIVIQLTGPSPFYQTWFCDGTNWSDLAPAHHPSGTRTYPGLAWDETRDAIILFGGNGGTGSDSHGNNDTWVFDGTDWTQDSPVHMPSKRQGVSMEYDAGRGWITMTGGYLNQIGGGLTDIWKYVNTEVPVVGEPGVDLNAIRFRSFQS
jgi:hypothetical protein